MCGVHVLVVITGVLAGAPPCQRPPTLLHQHQQPLCNTAYMSICSRLRCRPPHPHQRQRTPLAEAPSHADLWLWAAFMNAHPSFSKQPVCCFCGPPPAASSFSVLRNISWPRFTKEGKGETMGAGGGGGAFEPSTKVKMFSQFEFQADSEANCR